MTALELAKDWLRYAKSDLNTAAKNAIEDAEKIFKFCDDLINQTA
jgi:HEPN domain-containing protein